MKRSLLLLICVFVFQTVYPQVLMTLIFGDKLNSDKLEFGLEGGGNFSAISGLDTKKYFTDWNLGFYFDILLKEKKPWYFNTGVLVKSRVGAGKLTENDLHLLADSIWKAPGTYNQKINYFLVPLQIKYRKSHFYGEGGIMAGLMYKAWVEYTSDVPGFTSIVQEYNKELVNRIDLGAMVGTGYRFKGRTGWTVGIRYYQGFVNVFKDIPKTKNRSFFVKVNIPIGRSEKAQAKQAARKKEKEAKKAAKAKNHEK